MSDTLASNGRSRHWLTALITVLVALTGWSLREMNLTGKKLAALEAQFHEVERRVEQLEKKP